MLLSPTPLLLLLVAILSQALLAFVRSDLVALTLFSTRHIVIL